MKLSKHRKHSDRRATPPPATQEQPTGAAQTSPASSGEAGADAAAPVPPAAGSPTGADSALIREVLAGQGAISQTLAELSGQNLLQRQQMNQVYAAVGQLYQAVSAQCQQLLQSDTSLQQELQKFQTAGAQRAMAGLFHKLFRDLIKHANELDDVVVGLEGQTADEAQRAWSDSIRILRDRYESILRDWGCMPMAVAVGAEEFDPERHEAVEARPGDVPPDALAHVIVKVRRRGWVMGDQILQYPQVVVS